MTDDLYDVAETKRRAIESAKWHVTEATHELNEAEGKLAKAVRWYQYLLDLWGGEQSGPNT